MTSATALKYSGDHRRKVTKPRPFFEQLAPVSFNRNCCTPARFPVGPSAGCSASQKEQQRNANDCQNAKSLDNRLRCVTA